MISRPLSCALSGPTVQHCGQHVPIADPTSVPRVQEPKDGPLRGPRKKGARMEKHLLITRFDSARAARGEMLAIEDVLEVLSIPLLGIIPESEAVLRASNLGTPVTICGGD